MMTSTQATNSLRILRGDITPLRRAARWTREEAIAELKALGLDEGTVRAWLSRIALNPKVSIEFLLLSAVMPAPSDVVGRVGQRVVLPTKI
jgi:hypothetical protein